MAAGARFPPKPAVDDWLLGDSELPIARAKPG